MMDLDKYLSERQVEADKLLIRAYELFKKLKALSGYKVEELIEKFEAGWKLVPPEENTNN